MPFEFSVFALIMACVSVISIFLLIYPLLFRQKSFLTYVFSAMIATSVIWCVFYTLDIASTNFDEIYFFIKLEYIGIVLLPPIFLYFCIVFTKHHTLMKKPLISLLFAPSVIHYLFLITNDYHYLFYKEISLNTDNPFVNMNLTYGPAFYSHTIYSYILIAIGIIFIVGAYKKEHHSEFKNKLYEKQLFIGFLATLAPIFGNIIRITKLIPNLVFLDLTPILFVFSFILFSYALFETGFLDIVPIARERIFDDMLDGIVVLDSHQRIVDLNAQAYNILFSSDLILSDLFGKNFFQILKTIFRDEELSSAIDTLENKANILKNEKGTVYQTEIAFSRPNQKMQQDYFDLHLISIYSKKRKFIGFIIIIRNISVRKNAEISLKQKTKMQELILRLLSHDLRSHLFTLQGYAEIAKESKDLKEIDESLHAIDVKGSAILSLIDQVTNYLRTQDNSRSEQMEKMNLAEIIEEAISLVSPEAESKNITLEFTMNKNLKNFIYANNTIRSAVLNLLQNAIKFSPKDAKVKIELKEHNTKNKWKVTIEDQGPGIPDELKESIFEPFTAYGAKAGTGLGLTIVLDIIQSHSGEIWVEDGTNNSSRFIFTLPKIT
ncbi:MAG: sensor histidine kinase [Candidatus Hodarchaeales archaeon]